MKLKTIYINIKIIIILLLILFVIAEIYARLFLPRINEISEIYGWKLKSNLNKKIETKDLYGKKYTVDFKTNNYGMREYGKQNSDIKILVIGDSYVAEPTASNNDMWYSVFAQKFELHTNKKIHVLAGGSSGWSTFQQYLLIKEIKRSYDPDLFILQFCENDFSANLYSLEKLGLLRQQFLNRPYVNFVDKNLISIKENSFFSRVFRFLVNNFRVFSKLDALIQKYQFKKINSQFSNIEKNLANKLNQEALSVTTKLLIEIRKLFIDTPAILINCYDYDKNNYFYKKWKKIGIRSNFYVIIEPSEFVGEILNSNDAKFLNADASHLNKLGNNEYGNILFHQFIRRKIHKEVLIK